MKLNKILLVINIFFLQSYLIRFHIGNYPTNLQEILIALQIFAFIYAVPFKEIFATIRKHWVILSLVLLTGISILTIPAENSLDMVRHGKFLLFAIILGFIFIETLKTKEEKEAGIRIMGAGALAFGIFSLIYNLIGLNITHDNRLLGPMDAAVYLAFYLTPFFIYFTIKFFEKPKVKINLAYAIALGLLILATRSMGAIGGGMLVIFIYFLKRSELPLLNKKASKAAIALLAIATVVIIFYNKILPTLETNYSSLDERGEIWQTSSELLKNDKTVALGLGFGQFQEHYQKTADTALGRPPLDYIVLQPHNIFLLFIFQYGITGLLFILACIYMTLRNTLTFKGKPEIQTIVNFMLLYFFIHGLIDTPFFKNDLMILLVLFMEIALLQPGNKTD